MARKSTVKSGKKTVKRSTSVPKKKKPTKTKRTAKKSGKKAKELRVVKRKASRKSSKPVDVKKLPPIKNTRVKDFMDTAATHVFDTMMEIAKNPNMEHHRPRFHCKWCGRLN